MKGATAEPSVNTIKDPNNNSTRIMGAIQSFFLSTRNPSRSLINSIISTVSLVKLYLLVKMGENNLISSVTAESSKRLALNFRDAYVSRRPTCASIEVYLRCEPITSSATRVTNISLCARLVR